MPESLSKSYPLETAGTGLLLTGSIGVGKTHLAVGILQALVTERGATGIFFDYRDLFKQVQNSYNRQVAATELEILAPVFDAEVLVLDELGASKPTDWVWDTVAHILNTRYNDRRTTIITTNYANLRASGERSPERTGIDARRDARRPHRRAHALPPCRRCALWWRCREKTSARRSSARALPEASSQRELKQRNQQKDSSSQRGQLVEAVRRDRR